MYPYVLLCSIAGFFPGKIESSKYVFSGKSFIWSTIVMVAYTGCVLGSVYSYNFLEIRRELAIDLHFHGILQLGSMTLFISYVVSRSRIQSFESVSDLSRMLPSQIFRQMGRWMYIKDVIHVAPFICDLLLALCNIVFTPSLIKFTLWFTFFMIVLLNKLFINSLYVLTACFEKINESLMELKELLITDQPHLLRRVYHTQKNPVLLRKVKTLKKRHLEVSKVFHLLTDTFTLGITGTITLIIFDVTFNVYKCIVKTSDGRPFEETTSLPYWYAAFYFTYLMSIVYTCEVIKSQAKAVAINIHRILITTSDEELSQEVRQNEKVSYFRTRLLSLFSFDPQLGLFSIQVYQQDIAFLSLGNKIDATLLTKVYAILPLSHV